MKFVETQDEKKKKKCWKPKLAICLFRKFWHLHFAVLHCTLFRVAFIVKRAELNCKCNIIKRRKKKKTIYHSTVRKTDVLFNGEDAKWKCVRSIWKLSKQLQKSVCHLRVNCHLVSIFENIKKISFGRKLGVTVL